MHDRGETVKSISTEGMSDEEGGEGGFGSRGIGFPRGDPFSRRGSFARLVKRNWKETKRLGGLLEEDTIGCAFSCTRLVTGERIFRDCEQGEGRDYVEGIRWKTSRNVLHLKDGDK